MSLNIFISFIFLSYLSNVYSHSAIKMITPDYHSNDHRLPDVMNAIIGQITALHILKNENNYNYNDNNKIETLFLVMSYSDYSHCLMALTEKGEYYVITPEKMYHFSFSEEYATLQQKYKLLYYENLGGHSEHSEHSIITLQDVDDYMQNIDLL